MKTRREGRDEINDDDMDKRRSTRKMMTMIIGLVVEVKLGSWPQIQAKEQGAGTGVKTEEEEGKDPEPKHNCHWERQQDMRKLFIFNH